MTNDAELLRRYAEGGPEGEAAFAAWVQQHLGLVYAAALRRLDGDAHGAADVAQRVFAAAAREARSLATHATVTGWLYTTTRRAALNHMRDDQRRKQRERVAGAMGAEEGSGAVDWEQLRPVLDAAMDELGATDREAVLLRFFEERAFAEVGERLRMSENTARMRVERALEKLHALLARRGVTSTAAALATMLANQAGAATAALATPTGLAGSVTSAALAGAAAGSGGAVLGFFGFMSSTKWAVGGVLVIGGLLGTATWEYAHVRAARVEVTEQTRTLAALEARIRDEERQAAANAREAAQWTAKLAAEQRARASAVAVRKTAATEVAAKSAQTWDPVGEGHAMMARHPVLKRAVLARADAITDFGFAPMYRELGLTAEQIEAFRAFKRATAAISIPGQGPNGETLAFFAGEEGSLKELTARLKAALGDENYARLTQFERLSEARARVGQWATSLAFSDTPMSNEQAQGLMQLMMETTMNPGRRSVAPFDWEIIMARAPAILSGPQVQALGTVRTAAGKKGGKE